MMPPTENGQYKPEAIARAALHVFVYDFDPRTMGVPKRIDPALVEKFLAEELGKGRPTPAVALRLGDLADFYRTRTVIPHFLARLDRQERKANDLISSAYLTITVGVIGNRAEFDFGRSYYHHLLAMDQANNAMTVLLSVLVAYAPEESSQLTIARMDEFIGRLAEQDEDDDPAAATARREMEDLRNMKVPRIEAAAKLRREIMAIVDPAARLDILVAMYLGIDMRYQEQLARWAPRMLLDEAAAGRKPAVIDAFRRALEKLDPNDPNKSVRRPRTVHAIEFFGGALSPQEKAEIRPDLKFQDLLSTD